MADPDGALERSDRDGRVLARARAAARRAVPDPIRHYPARIAALSVALGAGIVVFALASRLFPYHSANHDEGVYLLQAAMLLEGRLELYAGDLAGSLRPWFFVRDGGRLYPKYAPVPAAIFAIGTALGEARISLGLVAAGNAALCYALASAAWDRTTGVVAAVALVASPLFLLSSSVFLPYAPTALLAWTFAWAYVRTMRRRRLRDAVLAGAAIGVAFFARPYTAVLFAAPFIAHALWTLLNGARIARGGVRTARGRLRAVTPVVRTTITAFRPLAGAPVRNRTASGTASSGARGDDPSPLEELASRTAVLGVVATFGLAGVGVALLYNRAVAGSALLFPYEAFAPMDGPGFGRREILDHSIEYTPELAARANAHVLWYLATRWIALGPLGAVLAAIGLGIHARGGRTKDPAHVDGTTLRWLLVGLVPAVVLGNLAFWGNYNALATMSDPTDGLAGLFGPFYHFDLLLPIAGFAAAGALGLADRLKKYYGRATETKTPSSAGARGLTRRNLGGIALAALVVLAVPVGVVVQAAVLGPPLERNAANTAAYERAYAPFAEDDDDLGDALVFVPTTYGTWLQHPFQWLRNDPGLDGETVYALDRDPGSNFAVIDAYPDRDPYRYTYRGEWTPDGSVSPKLEALEAQSSERLTAGIVLGVPPGVEDAGVTVIGEDERIRYDVVDAGSREEVALEWHLAPDGTAVAGEAVSASSGSNGSDATPTVGADSASSISVPSEGTISLLVTLTQFDGSTMTYRFDLAVRTVGDDLEVLWPAERKVCLLTTDCGREGTYLPEHPEEHPTGTSIETDLRVAANEVSDDSDVGTGASSGTEEKD